MSPLMTAVIGRVFGERTEFRHACLSNIQEVK